ncbi:MFS family permease [Streptomyces griseochromogenes]|uniref:MFS family permease n=1 Tax=Streptomyces griseochromogenes TaxID=68214 RepID=A0ABS4LMD7_9ACTN|nr:hypothetical protein [Streptomyces griseochromogenes]MBP2048564.1 MFS family permease [Streptomyces griseochromogenes]
MPLPALSLSVFALCSAAYALIGPLLDVSHDLHVSVATAGQLLSPYAIEVTIGGPIVTVIGEQWGWRATFRVVACCAVLGVAAITLLVPSHLGGGQKLAIRAELATVTRKQVLWAPAITAACQTGRATVRKGQHQRRRQRGDAVAGPGLDRCGRRRRLPDRHPCRAPCAAGHGRGRQQPGTGTRAVVTMTTMSGRRRSTGVRPRPRPAPRRVRRKEDPCVP